LFVERPQPNKETAFRQWRPISSLTTILLEPEADKNPLAICDAIKERLVL
jgi:hypothetical protein